MKSITLWRLAFFLNTWMADGFIMACGLTITLWICEIVLEAMHT